ncbi:cytochrome P450 [Streptomyces sp. NPDC004376]
MGASVKIPELPMPRECPFSPPPQYREITAEQPVVQIRTPRGDMAWLVTRHEDVRAVLTDRRFSSDPRTLGFPTYLTGDLPPAPGFFLVQDEPDHGRLRRTVTREFLISHMEALRPRMQEILDGLIDDMLRAGTSADLVQDVAYPMASTVIFDLLGVPYEDSQFVRTNTDTALDRSSTPEEAMAASAKLVQYFDQLVTAKKQEPSDDMVGRLVASAEQNDLTHEELVGLAALMLVSGYDTMAQMIGLGTLALLEHPGQLDELKADESLLPGAVEELMRYLTVNHSGLPRAALEDVTVGGQLIRANEGVLVMLNAANRDDAVFEDPDTLNIRRESGGHVAFGYGFHKCIGLTLARVELQTVFGGLFKRLPTLRLSKPVEELPFRHEMVLYGVRELPVEW